MGKKIRIAFDAGHGPDTPGKRCAKELDPNETREYFLNSRIADKVQASLLNYKDVEVLRVDDGKNDIPLSTRCYNANKWNADIYCSFHHDASPGIITGGGITVYTFDDSEKAQILRSTLYDCLIKNGGIRGNRSQPLRSSEFYVLANTKMQAVLVEHGFMTSSVDVPIILTDEYAEKIAKGWIDFFEKYFTLEKKSTKITYQPGKYRLDKNLRLRESPKLTAPSDRTLKKGSVVEITKVSGNWGYIESLNRWIAINHCTLLVFKIGTYKLTKALRVRKGTSLNAEVIKGLKKGTKIKISQVQGEWGYIEKYKGWIPLKWCNNIS